jgi:hypothetical protein
MKKVTTLVGFILFALIAFAGYQIGSAEFANYLLKDDIQDMAAQLDLRTGYGQLKTDSDYRAAVVSRANEHGIDLDERQVTVRRGGGSHESSVYIAADYTVTYTVFGHDFDLHFTPSSEGKVMF